MGDLAPNTKRTYRERYEYNVKPVIGKMRLTDVKPMHCKMVFNRMEASYAGSTIRQTYIAMGTMFRAAVMNDMIQKHPMDGVRFTKPVRAVDDIKCLTTDEQQKFMEAAKRSHSWEFIRRLPNGLDTILYEDSLSQGQKQLLCITRVMLCLPPMLILDEATSSIDTRTEMLIQEAFDRMMQGRTSFIVAHRLSTIRNADEILVMKDGSIIEQGNHEELMAKGGFYQKLYNSQFVQVSE